MVVPNDACFFFSQAQKDKTDCAVSGIQHNCRLSGESDEASFEFYAVKRYYQKERYVVAGMISALPLVE